MATLTQIAPPVKKRRAKPTNRDILARLLMAAWLCVILQGALRKWIAPGAGILYLLQDVPLALAYVFALWKGLVWGGKLAWMCVILSFVLAIHAMLQVIFVDLMPRVAIIGLHQYIFYLPILVIAPVCYNHKNRLQFIRWNMLMIVPMALIGALQSRAPAGAWINRTSNGEDTRLGGIGMDKVRATGTFNFTVTYALWCGFAVGLVVGEWLSPPSRRVFKSKAMLLVCTLGAIVAPLVSGSRLAVLLAGLAFAGGFLTVIITRNVRLILRFSAMLVLLPILTVVGYFAAPSSFQAVVDRFSGEQHKEELGSRIEKIFTAFSYASRYSVLGVGIGYGIPAANPGAYGFNLSENESIRIIGELGTYTGIAVIAVRYISGVFLFFACVRALQLPRGHALPHALPLMFTMAPTLAVGELTSAAPVVATQVYFWVSIILGALLFRSEPIEASLLQMSKTR